MLSIEKIQGLLCCPNCRGSLKIETISEDEFGVRDGRLHCSSGRHVYSIREGIFYLQAGPENIGPSRDWNLDSFNNFYKNVRCYRSSIEWLEIIGIPKQVAEYEYARVKGRLLEWLESHDDSVILDIGTGSGYFIFEMINICGGNNVSFIGIDPSVAHIRWLEHRRREENQRNILTVVGDARALPFQKQTFDTIVCTDVLEHIPAKQQAIHEIADCLKTGGILLLSTPSKKFFDSWHLASAPLRLNPNLRTDSSTAPYDRPIPPNYLRQYMREAGFALEKFELNVILPPFGYLACLPKFAVPILVGSCGFLEKHMKRLLAPRFAMNIVVRGKKTSDSTSC